jgi:L-seryl-tRNA(Ser) seleniumtransferase
MENISVNKLTDSTNSSLPRDIKVALAKEVLAQEKDIELAKEKFAEIVENLEQKKQREVVNATGTVLHTNLGRSPNNIGFSGRYTNVEYDLKNFRRGIRNEFLSSSLSSFLGCEGVTFVNNNASSLYLSLRALAKNYKFKNVIISRGEIIEIGGSYRLPEIIKETGLQMIEVGTTNKTNLNDYTKALKDFPNSIILKVHRSNYSISGFTEEVNIGELTGIKENYDTVLIHDLGSGLVVDRKFLEINHIDIFKNETSVQNSLDNGSDLVMFSGDKLFGSVQSGIIAGKSKYIENIKNYSLFRTYRCSPLTLFELQKTVANYINKDELNIPFWYLVSQSYQSLEMRIENIVSESSFKFDVEEGTSLIGGGTLPDVTMKSPVLTIKEEASNSLLNMFLLNEVPIIPYFYKNRICIDLRSVFEDQDKIIKTCLNKL